MSSLSTVLYSYFLIQFNCAILQEFYSVEVSAEVLSKRLAANTSEREIIEYTKVLTATTPLMPSNVKIFDSDICCSLRSPHGI